MVANQGLRAGTRDSFKRGYRKKGYIPLTTYLTNYKLGDFVDVVVNGAVQKVRAAYGSRPRWVAPAMRDCSPGGGRAHARGPRGPRERASDRAAPARARAAGRAAEAAWVLRARRRRAGDARRLSWSSPRMHT